MCDNKTVLAEKLVSLLSEKGVALTAEDAGAFFEKPSDPKMGDLALFEHRSTSFCFI